MIFFLAIVPWLGPVDNIDTVEINTWRRGTPQIGFTFYRSIIYRDPDGSIVDWRWYKPNLIPKLINGRYTVTWSDHGLPQTIYCNRVIYVYSGEEDREVTGRKTLSVENRRKLWNIH